MTEPRDPSGAYGVCLTVAYDGTDFAGWQFQPGLRTVQSELTTAVLTMSGEPDTLLRGASRTDAGVHADGQVVAFRAVKEVSLDGWLRGLNTRLPPDLSVQHAMHCPPTYDPRFDAIEKSYRYVFDTGRVRSPHLRRTSWHLTRARVHPDHRRHDDDATQLLDVAAMREAAQALVGTHDFRAFRAANDERDTSVRTLHDVRVVTPFQGEPRLMAMEVRGNAFLQHMVRIMAGTLLEVGRGAKTPADVAALLGPQGDRRRAGETAPPQGLTLLHISTRLSSR